MANFRYGTGYWATTPLTCPPNGCSARHGYHGCSLPRRRCCSAEQLERPVNIFLLYSTHISCPISIATLQAPQALSAGGVEGHAKRESFRGSVQGIYPYRVSTLTGFSDIFTITLLCVAQCFSVLDQITVAQHARSVHARSLPLLRLIQSLLTGNWYSHCVHNYTIRLPQSNS